MKGKLLINGVELDVEVSGEELNALFSQGEKKTGYERVNRGDSYFSDCGHMVDSFVESHDVYDNANHNAANYYSSQTVARNNFRADRLMRRLRRFAVTRRGDDLDWSITQNKYYILYGYQDSSLVPRLELRHRTPGAIYFDTREAADAAIEEFRDELIWYFTEYRDSL